jgi:hypothetical protein
VAKKEFIGITHEYDRLRIARLRVVKNGLELIEVDTLELPSPLSKGMDQGLGLFDTLDDHDDLNIFESDTSERISDSDENLLEGLDDPDPVPGTGQPGLEETFDMTKVDDDAGVAAENERLLADYFTKINKRKVNTGLQIPFGKTTFQFLKNVDVAKMSKKDQHEFFREKLEPIAHREILPDHYSWTKIGGNNCLLAYNPDDSELINLVELSETYYQGNIHINEILPEEDIWAGLARTNYNLEDDDITGLIGLGESSSRIVFMKGQDIVNTLPIITEGESSDDVLNTIFSKILFEIDKGNLPKITRLLVVRSSRLKENIISYLEKQFEDVDVEYLTPHPNNLTYADEILNSPVYLQPYLTAIGAAWAASKINEKEFSRLSLLPEYILEKQRMFKLEWHGLIMLALIALTPLFINHLYNTKAGELQDLQRENTLISSQIEDLRPIAAMTEELMAELEALQSENERLLELASYSQQWSETLIRLNEGVGDISSLWFTSVRSSDMHVHMSGYSLSREIMPMLANLFTDANIQQVSETEVRGQQVYSFAIQVNNIRQDLDEFLLDMPEFDFDAESPDEIEIDLSQAPRQNAAEEAPAEQVTAEATEQEPAREEVSAETRPDADPETGASGNEEARNQEPPVEQQPEEELPADPETETAERSDSQTIIPQSERNSEGVTTESSYGLMGAETRLLAGAYTIGLYSLESRSVAFSEYETLRNEGFKATLWRAETEPGRQSWIVGVGQFENVERALRAADELPQNYSNNHFIIRIR